jgi:GT2 family glycosyltransferase
MPTTLEPEKSASSQLTQYAIRNTQYASIIVPTRNGAHLLSECLDALRAQTFRDFETVVVDDASTDGTRELLRRYPEVRSVVLPGEEGHGFVMAANRGIAASSGGIVVLLNNDAVPDPEWLGELVGALDRNPWAGMAASRIMLYDRPDTFHSTGDYYGRDGVPNSRGVWEVDRGQYDREGEVFGICAAAAAIRRAVLADLAGSGGTTPTSRVFDPQLWMYMEDVDLNLRARLRSHRTVYVPTARVLHRLSATGGGTLASYYVGRNMLYVLAKDVPARVIARNLPSIVKRQAGLVLETLRNFRGAAARARLRGMVVGLVTWPRVLPARRRIMRSARISAGDFSATIERYTP